MTKPTARDVASFMLGRLNEEGGVLYQADIVSEIRERYGNQFVYDNESGNPAIDRKVLTEFRKLTEGKVVWSRGEQYWRFREGYDDPKSRLSE